MATKLETPALDAIALDPEVLVQFDPSLRPDEFGNTKLIAFHHSETGESERLQLLPGVHKMPLSQWKKWESNASKFVEFARSHSVIRKVSDKSDLLEIEKEDPFLAQSILKHTTDGLLLSRWVEKFEEMSPVLREAMILKDEALSAGPSARKRFVFGRQVA